MSKAEAPRQSPRARAARRRWQKRKSETTRQAILEAAMRCFIDYGYAKTSVPVIAEEAGMSRGAIVHHFPTRHELLVAVVTYLHELRIEQYSELMRDIDQPSQEIDHEHHKKGVLAAWKHLNLPSFIAYKELLAAARTDEELWGVMAPLEREFEEQFMIAAKEVFPRWTSLDEFTLANDLTQFALKGMTLSPIQTDRDERIANILGKVAEVVSAMYEEGKKKADSGKSG